MASIAKTYKRSMTEIFNASIDALKSIGFNITEKDNNSITASSGVSIWSWGEYIKVEFSSTPEGTKVKASSSAKAQLFDWGKSEENVSKFFSALEKQFRQDKVQ
jgi:hypothetical protein